MLNRFKRHLTLFLAPLLFIACGNGAYDYDASASNTTSSSATCTNMKAESSYIGYGLDDSGYNEVSLQFSYKSLTSSATTNAKRVNITGTAYLTIDGYAFCCNSRSQYGSLINNNGSYNMSYNFYNDEIAVVDSLTLTCTPLNRSAGFRSSDTITISVNNDGLFLTESNTLRGSVVITDNTTNVFDFGYGNQFLIYLE